MKTVGAATPNQFKQSWGLAGSRGNHGNLYISWCIERSGRSGSVDTSVVDYEYYDNDDDDGDDGGGGGDDDNTVVHLVMILLSTSSVSSGPIDSKHSSISFSWKDCL